MRSLWCRYSGSAPIGALWLRLSRVISLILNHFGCGHLWQSDCICGSEESADDLSQWLTPMLRIQFDETADETTIRMEGRFVGKYASDTLQFVLRLDLPPKTFVNLSEVSVVDEVGETVLACLSCLGLGFVADSAYALSTCERLNLPLVEKPTRTLPRQCDVLAFANARE